MHVPRPPSCLPLSECFVEALWLKWVSWTCCCFHWNSCLSSTLKVLWMDKILHLSSRGHLPPWIKRGVAWLDICCWVVKQSFVACCTFLLLLLRDATLFLLPASEHHLSCFQRYLHVKKRQKKSKGSEAVLRVCWTGLIVTVVYMLPASPLLSVISQWMPHVTACWSDLFKVTFQMACSLGLRLQQKTL